MPEVERYQNLVLGSGEAGKYIAWTMAKEGQHTAVVERKLIGGSCPNTSKNNAANTRIFTSDLTAGGDRNRSYVEVATPSKHPSINRTAGSSMS